LAAWALVCTAPAITCLVKAAMSSCVMRPLGPVPLTSSSGTPSSRANLRTEGLAWGRPAAGVPGWCAGTATETVAAAGAASRCKGRQLPGQTGAAAATGAGAGAAALAPSSTATRSPMLTVSPILTLSSLSTPAAGEGISMEALSDSTVNSDCSSLMVSPGLTSISITATSLKSPMSGTRTSMRAGGAAARAPVPQERRWAPVLLLLFE
jgi:hypothetical protein